MFQIPVEGEVKAFFDSLAAAKGEQYAQSCWALCWFAGEAALQGDIKGAICARLLLRGAAVSQDDVERAFTVSIAEFDSLYKEIAQGMFANMNVRLEQAMKTLETEETK